MKSGTLAPSLAAQSLAARSLAECELVAHRGNAAEFPENTVASLHSALSLGVRFVEFDVHLSADGIPMVMHDANLKRCAGVDRDALAMSAQELKRVPVGEASRFGDRFADITLPSLADVVSLLQSFPNARAFVELKRASLQHFGMEVMVDVVARTLTPIRNQVIIISFDLPAVCRARQVMRVPVGWVLPAYSTPNAIKAEATLPDYLFCDLDKLPGDIRHLWRGPWQWAFYEITQRQQAERLQSLGVTLLETMQVQHMQAVLTEESDADLPESSRAVI